VLDGADTNLLKQGIFFRKKALLSSKSGKGRENIFMWSNEQIKQQYIRYKMYLIVESSNSRVKRSSHNDLLYKR